MHDVSCVIVRSDGARVPIVDHSSQDESNAILALNPAPVTHYVNTASLNCLALGRPSPGGGGIDSPFQALARAQFSSPLFPNSPMTPVLQIYTPSRMERFRDVDA